MTMQPETTHQSTRKTGRTKFVPILLLAGISAGSSLAIAQSALPDAQIEANVLKALAGSSDLASQPIQTHTVYGTVTLTGTVSDESQRRQAENLASTAVGVKKVVDELTLSSVVQSNGPSTDPSSSQTAQTAQPGGEQADKLVLQSDGTYAPAQTDSAQASALPPQRNNPDADQALDQRVQQQQSAVGQGTPNSSVQPYGQNGYPGGSNVPPNPPYANQGRQPMNPAYPGYPPPGTQQYGYGVPQRPTSGQAGGQTVVVPANVTLRVRLNQRLSSDSAQPGQSFTGTVSADIVAGNSVAIPRGAQVRGTVVDVVRAGTLKGRGELSLQLNDVTLGGRTYPIVSDTWNHHAGDKTLETINHTAIGGGLGALVGAAAGGGVGAAIGAGVGGALGLGSAAGSRDAQVYLPAEAVLTFHLAQPATIITVSQEEMQRLAYGVPNGGQPPYFPRRRIYPYAPGYYRPYGPYGPYPYPYPY